MEPRLRDLLEAAARPFAGAGKYALGFARGKLRHDPAFFSLLRHGLLPDSGTLVDAGCGQGVLLALLRAARDEYAAGRWPQGWPAPPMNLALRGVDSYPGHVQLARCALGDGAAVDLCDLRDYEFPSCSVIVLLDVLLYLAEPEQDRVLQRAVAALEAGGLLLLREADADAGPAFWLAKWSAQVDAARRRRLGQRTHHRSAARWKDTLAGRGLAVGAGPMSEGTPFANVLFVARKVV